MIESTVGLRRMVIAVAEKRVKTRMRARARRSKDVYLHFQKV